MALQLFADGVPVYHSMQDSYTLIGLETTEGLNKAGTCKITMPPDHPAYNAFVSHKTVVTLYDGDKRRFRGRALYPSEDFYNIRTITCEGERGFFQDAIHRPYLYQDSPAVIFSTALALYNGMVDPWKRFTLGVVTVTDANDYVRLESESAETFADFFNKLVDRCGGYITFEDDGNGGSVINWLEEVNTQSTQSIEFGQNLLDFTRSGQTDELATAILPYGAQMEDGLRVTISSVTKTGEDWIQDDEAVALRGLIMATNTWDDVTEPRNLLTKARQWLAEHKLAVTSLQLSAADLSRMDKSISSFYTGDRVRVVSKPHGVNDWFQLTERTIDWLDPAGGEITLGATQTSLTGADMLSNRNTSEVISRVRTDVLNSARNNTASVISETTLELMALIEQTADNIMATVSEEYMNADGVNSLISSKITQLSDSVTFTFAGLTTRLEEIDGESRTLWEEWRKYVRIDNGDLLLGEDGNEITLRLENDIVKFLDGGAEVAYISNKQLVITDAHFLNSIRVGNFALLPRKNGNLSLMKVGG